MIIIWYDMSWYESVLLTVVYLYDLYMICFTCFAGAMFWDTSLLSSISHAPLRGCHVSVFENHTRRSASTWDDDREGCMCKPYFAHWFWAAWSTTDLSPFHNHMIILTDLMSTSPLETHNVCRPPFFPPVLCSGILRFLLLISFPLWIALGGFVIVSRVNSLQFEDIWQIVARFFHVFPGISYIVWYIVPYSLIYSSKMFRNSSNNFRNSSNNGRNSSKMVPI